VNKKKQKNFIHLPMAGTVPDMAIHGASARHGKKFFCFFFSKKRSACL
jgi:hypothetical protein